jgi:hypothetical protein
LGGFFYSVFVCKVCPSFAIINCFGGRRRSTRSARKVYKEGLQGFILKIEDGFYISEIDFCVYQRDLRETKNRANIYNSSLIPDSYGDYNSSALFVFANPLFEIEE